MKTRYDILWIDDQIDAVTDDIADVSNFLEKHGIEPAIKPVPAMPDGSIHSAIASDLTNPDLDLIVVDFSMDGLSGPELIKEIRETDQVYLPVIFYSQFSVELHEEAAANQLDGVYISSRDNVRRKTIDVIRSLLKKEQTTKRTRGLLMEVT